MALAPLADLLRPRRAGGRSDYPPIALGSWLRFGAPAVLLRAATGQIGAFVRLPPAFGPVQALAGLDRTGPGDRLALLGAAAAGVVLGVGAGLLLTAWRTWRGRPEGSLFGDASAVRPRGPDELRWAAVVAITAGITEEAYFRLLLPLLTAQATGSALAGFVGAALLFGSAHRYQGWRGMLATTVAAGALTLGYLATGNLLAMMAVHAAGDVGQLVLRPALRLAIERRRERVGSVANWSAGAGENAP